MSSIPVSRSKLATRTPRVDSASTTPNALDNGDRTLYRFGGVAVLVAAVLAIGSIGAYIVWPPPTGGAAEWFRLYDGSAFRGMVSLDLPYMLVSFLMLPVMLALFTALRPFNPTAVLVAVAVYVVTFAAMLASNPMVEMLTLSGKYMSATTVAEQTAFLGAGEAMLAAYEGTAFHLFYIGGQLAGIALGIVMLRANKASNMFTKPIAFTMIAGNLVGFGLYLPTIGLALSVFSGIVLLVWMILLGRRLLELAAQMAA